MKVRLDFHDRDNLIHWTVIAMAAGLVNEKLLSIDHDEEGPFVDITVQINGQDVSENFVDAIKRLEKHMDEEIEKKAVQLITEKFAKMQDEVYDIHKSYIRKVCALLDVNQDDLD